MVGQLGAEAGVEIEGAASGPVGADFAGAGADFAVGRGARATAGPARGVCRGSREQPGASGERVRGASEVTGADLAQPGADFAMARGPRGIAGLRPAGIAPSST